MGVLGDRAFWMTRRIMHIGRQAIALDRVFAGLVAQGVGSGSAFQAFINMGVNLGRIAHQGLTLPLMSYGGSAILMNLVALAVVLPPRAGGDYLFRERARMMRGGQTETNCATPAPRLIMAGSGAPAATSFPALAVAAAENCVRAAGASLAGPHPQHGGAHRAAAGLCAGDHRLFRRGKGLSPLALLPLACLRALLAGLAVVRRVQPDVVVGLGGYISFPAA